MSRPPLPVLFLFPVIFSLFPVASLADPGSSDATPGVHTASHEEDVDKTSVVTAKNAGSIDGQVVSVDYKAGRISVKAAAVQYDVIVLPSTEFLGHNNNFHTIADIQKGARVQVMMSRRAGTYTAQIIRLF